MKVKDVIKHLISHFKLHIINNITKHILSEVELFVKFQCFSKSAFVYLALTDSLQRAIWCHLWRSIVLHNHSFSLLQVRRQEQKRGFQESASGADSSSRHSGTGNDSGFGSDSARIRIVQIEQQCGASHHCIARPSQKSTITKNLSFIPFDIFLTASKLSIMTYACFSPPKVLSTMPCTPSTEKKEPTDKVEKKTDTCSLFC